MGGQIINGEEWIAERLAFLRHRLTEELPVAEREAIEAEIRTLSTERGLTLGGTRVWRRRRWLHRKNP